MAAGLSASAVGGPGIFGFSMSGGGPGGNGGEGSLMPWFDFTCLTCEAEGRLLRQQKPKYCNRKCKSKGMSLEYLGYSLRPAKHIITPHMVAQIKKVYQENTGNGEVNELARRLGLPRWKVNRYAISQGWVAVQKREPAWTDRELRILEQSAHLQPNRIRLHLKRIGHNRTETAIAIKRKRLRLLQNLQGQSANQLAECFGIDAKTVTRWIQGGHLKARRRGTARTALQGGDMWFIKDLWVRQFILSCPEFVDLRKVDKFWFIDILTGPSWGAAEAGDDGGDKH